MAVVQEFSGKSSVVQLTEFCHKIGAQPTVMWDLKHKKWRATIRGAGLRWLSGHYFPFYALADSTDSALAVMATGISMKHIRLSKGRGPYKTPILTHPALIVESSIDWVVNGVKVLAPDVKDSLFSHKTIMTNALDYSTLAGKSLDDLSKIFAEADVKYIEKKFSGLNKLIKKPQPVVEYEPKPVVEFESEFDGPPMGQYSGNSGTTPPVEPKKKKPTDPFF